MVLAAIVLVWIGFFDTYSLWTRYQLSANKKTTQHQIDLLKAEIDSLNKRINALENDPLLLERIAREKYGMRKPDEQVYRVVKD